MNGCRSHSKCFRWLVGSIAVAAVTIVLSLRRYPRVQTSPRAPYSSEVNATDTGAERSKRFIVFSGSGVVKLVLGTSFPIILADKKRSLNHFYNLQMQYTPPPIPLYWWSLYNTSTFAARKQRSANLLMQYDNSRSCVYEFIETIFQRSAGNFENECLLRFICEMARAPLSEDFTQHHHDDRRQHDYSAKHEYPIGDDYGRNIYHKLINVIFTPQLSNVNHRYLNAYAVGSSGANCDELFAKCSAVNDWLKRFTRLI